MRALPAAAWLGKRSRAELNSMPDIEVPLEAQIEGKLDAACGCLIDPTPENLRRCSTLLASAAGHLAESPPASVRRAALRKAVHRARRLLESAAEYHRGCHTVMLTLAASGYTPDGALASSLPATRLSLHG